MGDSISDAGNKGLRCLQRIFFLIINPKVESAFSDHRMLAILNNVSNKIVLPPKADCSH